MRIIVKICIIDDTCLGLGSGSGYPLYLSLKRQAQRTSEWWTAFSPASTWGSYMSLDCPLSDNIKQFSLWYIEIFKQIIIWHAIHLSINDIKIQFDLDRSHKMRFLWCVTVVPKIDFSNFHDIIWFCIHTYIR